MPSTPILIGVHDLKSPLPTPSQPPEEPATLIQRAVASALQDAHAPRPEALHSAIDSIDIVASWTWPYEDLPGLVAEKLGIPSDRLRHKRYSAHGGNQSVKLLDEAARRVGRGEVKLAVVAGGEALASCR
jgi:hypothetical protein